MIPDADLPIFSFRVNWRDGVVERLSWLTDIIGTDEGREQRRELRLSPRREYDVTIMCQGTERSYMDLWLHRLVAFECMVPMWPDQGELSVAAPAGSNALQFDTTGLDFREGDFALLLGPTALTSQRVEIVSVAPGGLVLDADLAKRWGRGSKVVPLRRGRLASEMTPRKITNDLTEYSLRLEFTRENDYPEPPYRYSGEQFRRMRVMTREPDTKQAVDYAFAWDFQEMDSATGRQYRTTESSRAFYSQQHTVMLRGRKELVDYRQYLYNQKGRLKPIWVPTFEQDMLLVAPAAAAQKNIVIQKIGYTLTGGMNEGDAYGDDSQGAAITGATNGRRHVMIQMKNGQRVYRRIDAAVDNGDGTETITFDEQLYEPIVPAKVKMISFLDTMRLDSDSVEIAHKTAAGGVARVQVSYKAFRTDIYDAFQGWLLRVWTQITPGPNNRTYAGGWFWHGGVWTPSGTEEAGPYQPGVQARPRQGARFGGPLHGQTNYESNDANVFPDSPTVQKNLRGQVAEHSVATPDGVTVDFYYDFPSDQGYDGGAVNIYLRNQYPAGSGFTATPDGNPIKMYYQWALSDSQNGGGEFDLGLQGSLYPYSWVRAISVPEGYNDI